MRRLLLLALALAVMGSHVPARAIQEVATIQIPDVRFYSVKAIDLVSQGRLNLLAAGQVNHQDRNDALLIAFSMTNGTFTETAREVFRIGAKGNTRIRSLVCIRPPERNTSLAVASGKGGPENQEKGFIRSYGFDGKTFYLKDSTEFSDPKTSYTHGYPLIQADVNGDGKGEIVYGGFAGENDRDHADIRIFSIGEDGRLSQLKGHQTERLNGLRLRVNALTSGDFNGDGIWEVVAAGRTVEEDVEHAAFALFTDQNLIWKQLKDLGSCRYRYATVMDMNGGTRGLVLAGRINQGDTLHTLVDLWQAEGEDMQLISRYRFTGAGSTRLRLVEPIPGLPGHLIIGGRLEVLERDRLRWQGFLQEMSLESGTLSPCSKPILLDKDWETRVRTMEIFKDLLLAGGFTEDKNKASTGFISIYRLK